MNRIFRWLIVLFLTLISARHFFHAGFPVTHDGNNHLIRFANYKIALREGQIPPRLAPNLVNGYGYPVFNYNYPLANIISVPFSILNIHYETSLKIIFGLSIFLSLWGADVLLAQYGFRFKTRLFALFVLALNPYLLTSIIYRGNIGEIMAFATLPWIFYFLSSKKWYYLTISLLALFLSHNISALFASALILFQALFSLKNWSDWKKFIQSFLAAFAMGLWFWLPALAEKNLITLDGVDLTLNFDRHFPTLSQLLRMPIHFGYSYWGSVDSMSYGIGLIQLVILVISFVIVLKTLREPKNIQYPAWIVAGLLLFLGQLSLTKPLYLLIPFANFIQFPWRLSLLLAMTLVVLSALVYSRVSMRSQKLLWLLVLLQFWQLYQLRPIDYQYKNPIDYDADSGTTSVNQENMPKSFTYPFFTEKQAPVFILSGEGQVNAQELYGSYRKYQLELKQTSTIVESTAVFAGWETKANNQLVAYVDSSLIQGRIAYTLPAGSYQVESRFTQKTWPRLVGNSVSAITFLGFVFCWWLNLRRNSKMEIK